MKRSAFIQSLAALPLGVLTMKFESINRLVEQFGNTPKMPVLFLGHGSPMNAIEENEFVTGFRRIAAKIPKPSAILCISAHWETQGTKVTAMAMPRTIHDFSGFPKALFDVEYPAPGSLDLAQLTQTILTPEQVDLDHQWGLDHGAWSVLKHLYPDADVPVIQLSLDVKKGTREHYSLARELSALRHKGVLIVGSGNIVHNLRLVEWDKLSVDNYASDWAAEARLQMNQWIINGDHQPLIDYGNQGRAINLAIPTAEHFLPLLYVLAQQEPREGLVLFNDKAVGGALSMTSVFIGTES
jgi:4,5-DOPA dioxygenase extradiol